MKLVVGDYDTSVSTDTNFTAAYSIAQFLIHADYKYTTNQNDIALVRTFKDIRLNDNVGIVCLPWKYTAEVFANSTVMAAGWGMTEFGGPQAAILQKVQLNTIANADCQRTYKQVDDSFICTYTPRKDTCQVSGK